MGKHLCWVMIAAALVIAAAGCNEKATLGPKETPTVTDADQIMSLQNRISPLWKKAAVLAAKGEWLGVEGADANKDYSEELVARLDAESRLREAEHIKAFGVQYKRLQELDPILWAKIETAMSDTGRAVAKNTKQAIAQMKAELDAADGNVKEANPLRLTRPDPKIDRSTVLGEQLYNEEAAVLPIKHRQEKEEYQIRLQQLMAEAHRPLVASWYKKTIDNAVGVAVANEKALYAVTK